VSIQKIKEAIQNNKLSWNDIYEKCKKVLAYKFMYGLGNFKPDSFEFTFDENCTASITFDDLWD
jgi:hypothetical protein